jgi:hypothetical protein
MDVRVGMAAQLAVETSPSEFSRAGKMVSLSMFGVQSHETLRRPLLLRPAFLHRGSTVGFPLPFLPHRRHTDHFVIIDPIFITLVIGTKAVGCFCFGSNHAALLSEENFPFFGFVFCIIVIKLPSSSSLSSLSEA